MHREKQGVMRRRQRLIQRCTTSAEDSRRRDAWNFAYPYIVSSEVRVENRETEGMGHGYGMSI